RGGARGRQGEEDPGREHARQLGLRDGRSRERRAFHHEPQPALVAGRGGRGADRPVTPFELASPTRLVFGPGTLSRLGELARELGFGRTLLVADAGIAAA